MVQQSIFSGSEWQTNDKYIEWRESWNGKVIFREAKKTALKLHRKGIKAGIRDIWSFLRVTILLGEDSEGFKVNNNYSKLAAYEIESTVPELSGYFEHRGRND